jgi:hypothetical protein
VTFRKDLAIVGAHRAVRPFKKPIECPKINHQSLITKNQSPKTNYQKPITNHQSPKTNHQSPITKNQSPKTNHQKPITRLNLKDISLNFTLQWNHLT